MSQSGLQRVVKDALFDSLDDELAAQHVDVIIRKDLIVRLREGYMDPSGIEGFINSALNPLCKKIEPESESPIGDNVDPLSVESVQKLISPRIKKINVSHFRGLPDTSVDLKRKNLLVLGSNGKGKSNLVDAIEFFFSGVVTRVNGDSIPVNSLGKPGALLLSLFTTMEKQNVAWLVGRKSNIPMILYIILVSIQAQMRLYCAEIGCFVSYMRPHQNDISVFLQYSE